MSGDRAGDSSSQAPGASLANMPVEGELFAERYRIQRMLGRGGMGMVYLALQAPLERPVALKVLRAPNAPDMDPEFHSRFFREAEAAARLQHPHTITTYDFGSTDQGVPYIVMEYLEGQDLRRVLADDGPLPLERSLHIAKQVCKSLQDAHDKNMIHRDLKPSNVLLVTRDDDPNFVKVFDFGLVKFRDEDQDLTRSGVFLGSPRFTFPEALDPKASVDHRADVYSTGILIYTMVAGQPPFSGEPMAVLSAHLHEVPQPMCALEPEASSCAELEAVVARCLRKDPEDRYQSMRDLLKALNGVSMALDRGHLVQSADLSAARRAWDGEFADEDSKATERELSAIDEVIRPGPLRAAFRPLFGLLVAFLLVGLWWFLKGSDSPSLTDSSAPVPEASGQEQANFRDIGVALFSDEPGLSISYLDPDGRWQLLGQLDENLRALWREKPEELWWKARIESGQQVLSILLVQPGQPGRRLELPIDGAVVRFDLSASANAADQSSAASPSVANRLAQEQAPSSGSQQSSSEETLKSGSAQGAHALQPQTEPEQRTEVVGQPPDGDGGQPPDPSSPAEETELEQGGRSGYKSNPY